MYKISRLQIYMILLLALFIHVTFLDYVNIFGSRPDLLLICVIFFGLFLGEGAGFESGLLAGMLKDLFTVDFFGVNTLVFTGTGILIDVLRTKFFKESKMTQLLLVLFTVMFSMSFHFVLESFLLKYMSLSFREYFASCVMPTAIYTGLVSIPIFIKFIDIYNLKEMEDLL